MKIVYNRLNQGTTKSDTTKIGKKWNAPLGILFGVIKKIKAEYHISEYWITPTWLEQIFNNFVTGRDDLITEWWFEVKDIPTGTPTTRPAGETGYKVSNTE